MSETPSAERLVKAYVKIRAKKHDHKKEIEKLDEDLGLIEKALLEICKAQGASTIRTEYGTISRRVNRRYWTSDWDSFFKFVKERDVFSLLYRRLNNDNVTQFLEENPDLLPPGLNAEVEQTVTILKR